MKNKIDLLIDEAFADELLQLAPEASDTEKITKQVFAKLDLDIPEKPVGQKITKLPARRFKTRILLIAAILIVLTATGVLAASEILKLTQNKVDYFPVKSDVLSSSALESAIEDTGSKIGPDTTSPIFHQGLEAAIEQLNTPVGQTISYGGVTLTLDTVAMDSNFVVLFFTAEYEKAIDFQTIFPDEYPDGSPNISGPEYMHLLGFIPTFWMDINQDAQPEAYWPASEDGYFVDDQTIRFSLRYVLKEQYPDELTVHAKAYHVRDADGYDLLGQRPETTDANPFTFQVSIDKSEEKPYVRTAKSGKYTVNTENGEQTLTLERLAISPFGAAMTFSVYAPEDSHEIDGLYPYMLYMEDDKGNVIDVYDNPTHGSGFPYAGTCVTELTGLSPKAEAITFTPILYGSGPDAGEDREYDVEGIIGQKIETSPLGGFIVQDYTVSGSSVEVELEPYGRVNIGQRTIDIHFEAENITTANGHPGMIREQYNHETNRYIYAVDYYAATEEELKNIEKISARYTGYRLDTNASITIPLTPANSD